MKKWSILNIMAVIGFMITCYLWGQEVGEDKAKDNFPKEFASLKTSLSISEEKNIELMTDNKSLQSEVDRLKGKIVDLEDKLKQAETRSDLSGESSNVIRNSIIESPETHTIGEGKSWSYFDNRIFISVQKINTDSNHIKTVNIKASSTGYPIKAYESLGVGEKVTYLTDSDKYEIYVSKINYDVDIMITNIGTNNESN